MNEFLTMCANVNQQLGRSMTGQVITVVVFIAFIYLIILRPQKKKEKSAQELRDGVDIGDEIVTIGGIIGTVVSVKEDFIVIETSGDRNKIRLTRWSIHSNRTAEEVLAKKEAESKKSIKNNS